MLYSVGVDARGYGSKRNNKLVPFDVAIAQALEQLRRKVEDGLRFNEGMQTDAPRTSTEQRLAAQPSILSSPR